MSTTITSLADWYQRLRELARDNELEWVIAADAEHYRPAFEQGTSPEEEFFELAGMSEWRGCGCGGGG